MKTKRILLTAGLVLAATLDGWAAARVVAPSGKMANRSAITVDSTEPATVFLDGEQIGETPLRLTALAAGKHTLEAVALGTGESRVEQLVIPQTVSLEREVRFAFSPVVVQEVRVHAPGQVVYVPSPRRVVYAPYYARPRWHGPYRRHRGRRW